MPSVAPVILLDLGGVLVRLGQMPGVSKDAYDLLSRSPSLADLESGKISGPEYAATARSELDLEMSDKVFTEAFSAILCGLYPGAIELIQQLKSSGCTVAALSNTNAIHWPILTHGLGLREAFSTMFASHLIGSLKPGPAIYHHALNDLGCAPNNASFFDDRPENVEGARAVGIRAWQANGPEDVASLLRAEGLLL